MQSLTFDLEVITPMFLSGANQNDVELRPQSIKGTLRYWYRALLGGLGVIDLAVLKNLESKLWGSEQEGAKVVVKVQSQNMVKTGNRMLNLGFDKSNRMTRNPGQTYLLFSTFMGGNNRPYYDVGSTFSIRLSSNKTDSKWLSLASSALWCCVYLGAIGTRARRGAGDLRIIGATPSHENVFDLSLVKANFTDVNEYTQFLSKGISSCLNKVAELNELKRVNISGVINFPVINPNHLIIWVANRTWRSWQSGMEEVGKAFMNFRRRKEPDYTNVKDFIQSGSSFNTVERAYFGFPIIFRYTSLGGKSATVAGSGSDRRASPLWIKFVKLNESTYTVAFILSQDQFLPTGENLQVKSGRSVTTLNPPSLNILNTFLNELKAFNLNQVHF